MAADKIAPAKLLLPDGKSIDLPVVVGTENELAVDISQLRNATGYVTLDPAYVNTAACVSKITFLDGENGILRYRGYPIEELAEKTSFLEVAYLLLYGNLPNGDEKGAFVKNVRSSPQLPPWLESVIRALPPSNHPMSNLSATIVAMSGAYPQYSNPKLSDAERGTFFCHLIEATKNIVAYLYRQSHDFDWVAPNPSYSYCEDFLSMLFGEKPNPELVAALNVLLILHADHEQNCSTSTVRLVGSSQVNPFAAVAGGVNALWGPLHGGANQAVIEMLEDIAKDGGNYKKFLEKAKDKNDTARLMGFGHRVYKNFDPRAKIIKKACDDVLRILGASDSLLDIAKGLEEEALKDEYFIKRKLYPNVDFYSGIIYKAMKIPTNMFTAMFALGRLPGWLAQWNEMVADPQMKIGRPRQIYMGETRRSMK